MKAKGIVFATTLALALLTFVDTRAQDIHVGFSYLKMRLNGSLQLNLESVTGMHDYTPVVAYITTTDATGPDGRTLPANTLVIHGRATIDPTIPRVLSISLFNVNGPGTYDIMKHGGIVTYSDASAGASNFERILGWAAGVDEKQSSGSVTITEVGDDVPGMGWPVKGQFKINALGGKIFDPEYVKKRDQQKGLMQGEFSWGL